MNSKETSSKQDDSPESIHATCSLCRDRASCFYYCETCESCDISDQSSAQAARVWFCDGCVVVHIKQGHLIKNEKQQEPLICAQHKRLRSEYCRTCDISFCQGCLTKHSEHKFDSLETRASELETQVFTLLNKMEKKEKPLRKKQERVTDLIKNHKDKQTSLRETLRIELDKLKEFCFSIFDENETLLEDDSHKTAQAIEYVVDIQQRLRDLLNCSHAHLVQDFHAVGRKAQTELTTSNELTIDDPQIESLQAKQISDSFENFRTSIATQIKSTKFYEASTHYVCNKSQSEFYKISVGGGQLISEQINLDKSSMKHATIQSNQISFKLAIEKVYPLHLDNGPMFVLIMTKDKQAFFSFLPFQDECFLPVRYPSQKHILWPYYSTSASAKETTNGDDDINAIIHWSYWDEDKRQIRFTHNSKFNIQCQNLPFIRMSSSDCVYLVFVTTENNLVLTNLRASSFEVIELQEKIDIQCVSYEPGFLILWSEDGKSVYLLKKINSGWSTATEISWNKARNLLPIIRDTDGTSHYVYSYKINST